MWQRAIRTTKHSHFLFLYTSINLRVFDLTPVSCGLQLQVQICFVFVMFFGFYYKAPASVSLRNPLSQIAVIIQHCWIICCERELKYSLTFNGFFQGQGSFDVYWKAHCLSLDQQKQTIWVKDVSVCLQSCVLSEEVPYSNCHQHKMKIAIREVVCLYKLIITLIIYYL